MFSFHRLCAVLTAFLLCCGHAALLQASESHLVEGQTLNDFLDAALLNNPQLLSLIGKHLHHAEEPMRQSIKPRLSIFMN
jgi:hypothetical protein